MSDRAVSAAAEKKRPSLSRRLTRPLLVANSVLLVCLILIGYFLVSCNFYTQQTLSETAKESLIEQYMASALDYLIVFYGGDTSTAKDSENKKDGEKEQKSVEDYRDVMFNPEKTVFVFAFVRSKSGADADKAAQKNAKAEAAAPGNADKDETETNDAKKDFAAKNDSELKSLSVLDNDYYNVLANLEKNDPKAFEEHKQLITTEYLKEKKIDPAIFDYSDLMLRCCIRDVAEADRPQDDFFRMQHFVEALEHIKFAILLLFALSALAEGWLLTRLCTDAVERRDSMMLQELNRTPLYILAIAYALLMTNGIILILKPLDALHGWATFTVLQEIRPKLYLFFLLLVAMLWITSLLISTVRARLALPQWWKRSVIYRMINQPTVEQRLQFWISAVITLEFVIFFVVFRIVGGEGHDNAYVSRLMLAVDILLTLMILLVVYVQGKSSSGFTEAAHRIAQEQRGAVPVKGLRGQSLRHVQNINFLSRSASEHMERRFVNESFSIRLINSVSHGLRDPLTSVTRTVEQLQRGTLDEAQTQQKIHEVDQYSQELKKSIEDLLRIANASAGKMNTELTPTDVCMMVEQTMGEFYDRFRRKDVELVAIVPKQSPFIPADGTCMWTVFESVLNEFLLLAVRGTRVFLRAEQSDGSVTLRFQGTVRTDENAQLSEHTQYGTLDLPTAKIFTELQKGTFRYKYALDVLTVTLRFPSCAQGGADV